MFPTFPAPPAQDSPLPVTSLSHPRSWALVTSTSSPCPDPSVCSNLAPTLLLHGDQGPLCSLISGPEPVGWNPPAPGSSWLPSSLASLQDHAWLSVAPTSQPPCPACCHASSAGLFSGTLLLLYGHGSPLLDRTLRKGRDSVSFLRIPRTQHRSGPGGARSMV